MARILELQGLTFDDVLLVPRYSDFESRFTNKIDLSVQLLPNLKLNIPLISSNMSTITEVMMAIAMHNAGGIGFIHRYLSIEEQMNFLRKIYPSPAVITIGVNEDSKERAKLIYDDLKTYHPDQRLVFSIDIAHGHSKLMFNMVEWLRNNFPDVPIVAGNVATYKGAYDLASAGVHSIKLGVGNGGICSTRIQTGNGVPQATALMEGRKAIDDWHLKQQPDVWKPTIISDGGVKNSGDIGKALAAGADAIMSGGLFAGTDETPGDLYLKSDGLYKKYAGMASEYSMKKFKGSAKSIEGIDVDVPYKGSVASIIQSLVEGIRSCFSYQGAENIKELQKNAVFIRQTQHGFLESLPHAKLKG